MTTRNRSLGAGLRFQGPGSEHRRQTVALVAIAIAAIIYPPAFRALANALPIIPWPNIGVMVTAATFAILALGLNIVMGWAGLVDLGYVAFFAIGAYVAAFLGSDHFDIHIAWWLVVWVSVAAAALFGVVLGGPTLKLRGDYVAIVTFGFGEIVRLVFRNLGDITIALPAFVGGAVILGPHANLTGGNLGINPIDPPSLPIPGPWGPHLVFSSQNATAAWYLVLALLVLTYFVCRRLRDSKLGRAWMAVREDETAAAAMGINTVRTKLLAFALGASFSGFAGAFTAGFQQAIFAESFAFNVSILIVIMVILGGIGSLRGVVIGAFAVSYLDRSFLPWLGESILDAPMQALGHQTGIQFLIDFRVTTYDYLLFGLILAVMMVKRPEGLFPDATAKAEMHGVGISADETRNTVDEQAEAEEFELAQVEDAQPETQPREPEVHA